MPTTLRIEHAEALQALSTHRQAGEEFGQEVKNADRSVHERHGHREVVGLLPRDVKQQVGLVKSGQRRAGAANGQHLVDLVLLPGGWGVQSVVEKLVISRRGRHVF